MAVAARSLERGIKMRIYNGKDTLFWRDTWLNNVPLMDTKLRQIPMVDSYKTVEDYWEPNVG